MKELTAKEEEIMNFFWQHGPLFVKEILEFYDNPRPHFNTVSTIVRGLEEKGYIGHKPFGKTYQYYATVSAADMGVKSLKSIISRYFKNSYLGVVSSLVKDENISVDELRRLLDEVEKGEAGRNQQ
ncbi:MAG: BlaI/MecI/CopY family transcriptional regulator [Muribaculum sp.]